MKPEQMPGWPRGMSERLAAAYVGLGVGTFRARAAAKEGPKPIKISDRRKIWLKDELDAWLDNLAGRESEPDINPVMARLAEIKAKRNPKPSAEKRE